MAEPAGYCFKCGRYVYGEGVENCPVCGYPLIDRSGKR